MHITDYNEYYTYYSDQVGKGYAHPNIGIYKGQPYQRGSGIGSIFSNILKTITPLFKSALQQFGSNIVSKGVDMGNDMLQGANIKQTLKKHGKRLAADILTETANKIVQEGSGIKRHRKIKSRNKKLKNKTASVRNKSKRNKSKRNTSKRKIHKTKSTKRKESIFH